MRWLGSERPVAASQPEFWYDEAEQAVRFRCLCPSDVEGARKEFGTHRLPLTGNDETGWTLVSVEPLTVKPSIQCLGTCKIHGFITGGKWVPA
jgi:hypothetical protein